MGGSQLFVGVAAVCTLVAPLCCQHPLNASKVDFDSFRAQFQRLYEVRSEEFNSRHLSFQDAKKRQAYLNSFSAAPQSAKYGINQFSDLSPREFRDLYLRVKAARAPLFTGLKTQGLPAKFDWRDKAVVVPVQNQQTCGSCWAFSVVGAIQSVHAIEGFKLEQLSVQQVVDCSFKNSGCNGGSPLWALEWLKQTRVKLVPQSEYPYKAKTGFCHFFSQSHGGVAVKNFTAHDFGTKDKAEGERELVLRNDRPVCLLCPHRHDLLSGTEFLDSVGQEEAMMSQLVEHGPLAAVVDAVSWQDYLGGIIQHHCSSHHSNHAVLVVGYDTTGDIPYWIVQNSWGTTWGDQGYVYIKIGSNVCGIADSVAAVFL